MTRNFDIKTYFVNYVDKHGGKSRPLLIHVTKNHHVAIWKITTKYIRKSKYIRKYYFPLFHWYEYGLNQASYVDTKLSNLLLLTNNQYKSLLLSEKHPISALNYNDCIQFLKFINKNYPFLYLS